jgi:hypothetical protein
MTAVGHAVLGGTSLLGPPERSIRTTFTFAASPLWHRHLEEQVVGRDCRGKQTLGEGVIWPERHRQELLELVIILAVARGFRF